MNNKKLITPILLLLFLPVIIALPIEVIPDNFAINVTKDVSTVVNLQISNPNSYSLYNIKAEGDFIISSTIINTLNGYENASFSLTINADQKGEFDKVIEIVGFTRINCSATTPETYEMNITNYGVQPHDIEICQNDFVTFKNNYGYGVTLQIPTLSVNNYLQNGDSSVGNQFTAIGDFIYKIESAIDMGHIVVMNTFSNIYNKDNNGLFTLHINSKLEETTVTTSFSQKSFTMDYDEVKQHFFSITNTGSKTAEQITFIGDWFSFDKNNLNLAPGDSVGVTFVISPEIYQTSDTNKWYNKTIYISGDNIVTKTQNIDIFINQNDIAGGNLSAPEWWIKRKAFCDAFPTAPDCLTEPYIIYRDKVIYDAPEILTNMSAADVKRYLDEINGLRSDWTTHGNQWKLDTDIMKNGISDNNRIANESLSLETENTKDFNSFKSVFYIIFGTFIFLIMGCGAGFVIYKYYLRNMSIKEGLL